MMKRIIALLLACFMLVPSVTIQAEELKKPMIDSTCVDEELIQSFTFKKESSMAKDVTITTSDYGFIRPQLNSQEVEIYDGLSLHTVTYDNNGVVFAFDVSTQQEVDDLWNYYSSIYERPMLAYMFDYPEQFHFNELNTYGCGAEIEGYTLYIYFYYVVSDYFMPEYDSQASEIVNEVTSQAKGDRIDQIAYIHDWVVDHTEYDNDVANGYGTDEEYYFSHSSLGCLLRGKGVCETYAKVFKIMCKKLNIPCIYAISEDHAFNYVKMDDDKWYLMDCTWDDTTNSKDYFLISNQPYIDAEHTPLIFQYPTTPTTRYKVHDHDYVLLQDVAPTCTSFGYKQYQCSGCGQFYNEGFDALGHDFVETILEEPTCTSFGSYEAVCTVCNYKMTGEVEPLGHSYHDTIVPPTTSSQGYTLHVCIKCGECYEDEFTDPIVTPSQSVTDKFSDVGKGQWYVDYIQYAVDKGLMNGYAGTTNFGPENAVTREMMIQVLYNMAGKPKVTDYSATALFWDVYEGAWFEDAVCWAYNNGITTGMDGGFGTGKNMTREQMVRFLRNYAKEAGLDVTSSTSINSYPDYKEVDDWAKEDMAWGVATGMISGVTLDNVNYLQPLGNATRAQLATVLTRYCNYYKI